MKRSLMRPTAALFPAALLAAGLYSEGTIPEQLFLYWCMIQLFSLCSVEAFRNAAAREPGVRRVDKRFSGSIPVILLGIIVTCIVSSLKNDINSSWIPIAAAGCIIIEQLFEERMYAIGRNVDGVILSIVSNLLLLLGLLLNEGKGIAAPTENLFVLCAAGAGMLISIVTSYIVEPAHGFSLVPRNIVFFPKAAVQGLLYPAAALVLAAVTETSVKEYTFIFGGLVLWRLSRTICRRAGDESRPLNLLLVAVCALLIVGGCFVEELLPFGAFVLMALVCAMIVYCAPSVRLYAAFVLLCAAWLCSAPYDVFPITIACSAAAIILNLHKAFLRKV